MIKITPNTEYQFDVDLTHNEDLFFYLSISKNKTFDYSNEYVLHYRQSTNSAMKNIIGLELSYIQLIRKIKNDLGVSGFKVIYLRMKVMRILFLSFLFDKGSLISALKSPFKILLA